MPLTNRTQALTRKNEVKATARELRQIGDSLFVSLNTINPLDIDDEYLDTLIDRLEIAKNNINSIKNV